MDMMLVKVTSKGNNDVSSIHSVSKSSTLFDIRKIMNENEDIPVYCNLGYKTIQFNTDEDWRNCLMEWDKAKDERLHDQIMNLFNNLIHDDDITTLVQGIWEISKNKKLIIRLGEDSFITDFIIQHICDCKDQDFLLKLEYSLLSYNLSGSIKYEIKENLFEAILKCLLSTFDLIDEAAENNKYTYMDKKVFIMSKSHLIKIKCSEGNEKELYKMKITLSFIISVFKNINLNLISKNMNMKQNIHMLCVDIKRSLSTMIELIFRSLVSIALVNKIQIRILALKCIIILIQMIPIDEWIVSMHEILKSVPLIKKVVHSIASEMNELSDENQKEFFLTATSFLSSLARSKAGRELLNSKNAEDKRINDNIFKLLFRLKSSLEEEENGKYSATNSSVDLYIEIISHTLLVLWGCCDSSNVTFDNSENIFKTLVNLILTRNNEALIKCATGFLASLTSVSELQVQYFCRSISYSEDKFEVLCKQIVGSKNIYITHLAFWFLRNVCTKNIQFRNFAINRGLMNNALMLTKGRNREIVENSVACTLLLSEPASLLKKEDVVILKRSLSLCDVKITRIVACIVCALATKQANLIILSDSGIVLYLLAWVINLYYGLMKNGMKISKYKTPIDIQISEVELEDRTTCFHALEACIGSLWILFYDEVSSDNVIKYHAIDILCEIVNNIKLSFQIKNIAVTSLWLLVCTTDNRERIIEMDNIMRHLYEVSLNNQASPSLRLSSCQFLVFLVHGIKSHFEKLIKDINETYPFENIYISFLNTSNETLVEFASLGLARLSVNRQNDEINKQVIQEKKGLEALINWVEPLENENLLQAVTMAILNLSVNPQNQTIICNIGLYKLINLSRHAACNNMKTVYNYVCGILNNLTSNPLNRTLLYKAELSTKIFDNTDEKEDRDISLPHSPIKYKKEFDEMKWTEKQKESALSSEDKLKYISWFDKSLSKFNNNNIKYPTTLTELNIDVPKPKTFITSPIKTRKNMIPTGKIKNENNKDRLLKSFPVALNSIWNTPTIRKESPSAFGCDMIISSGEEMMFSNITENSIKTKRWNPLVLDIHQNKDKAIKITLCAPTKRHHLSSLNFSSKSTNATEMKLDTVNLCYFQHKEGCKTCEDLFPHYDLPNGKKFHIYHKDKLYETLTTDIDYFPNKPKCLLDFHISDLPEVLENYWPSVSEKPNEKILFPSISSLQPPFSFSKHVIQTKDHLCNGISCSCIGYPVEEILSIYTHSKLLNLENKSHEKKERRISILENFTSDIFKEKYKVRGSKILLETDYESMFLKDWERVIANSKFTDYLKKHMVTPSDLNKLKEVVQPAMMGIANIFYQFSCESFGRSILDMQMMSCQNFLEEISIFANKNNPKGKITPAIFGIVFNEVNFEGGRSDVALNNINNNRMLMRFEFIDLLVRIAVIAFKDTHETVTVHDAFSLLWNQVCDKLGSKINIKQDNFRVNRLLKPNPEKVLKKNLKTLKKIYDIANSKEMIVGDEGGITFNEFFNLMDYSQILNVGGLSRRIVLSCFIRSQILSVDEIKDRKSLVSLSFIEFLETLARIADVINLPTDEQIHYASKFNEKLSNAAIHAVEMENNGFVLFLKLAEKSSVKFARRESSSDLRSLVSTRCLGEKLNKFLQIFYYSIYPPGEGLLPDNKMNEFAQMYRNNAKEKKLEGLSYLDTMRKDGRRRSGKSYVILSQYKSLDENEDESFR